MTTAAEPANQPELLLTGAGLALPGPGGSCTELETFWRIMRDGLCCLSPFQRDGIPVRVAGQVRGWHPLDDPVLARASLTERAAARMSRAALLATSATGRALDDARLDPASLDERTLVLLVSLQFAYAEAEAHFAAWNRGGMAELRTAYWMNGTPPSVLATVCTLLGLECLTLSVAASCNGPERALHLATGLLRAGEADRVIVVGVDVCLDPVFLSGIAHESSRGYRPASISEDPASVRPHDEIQEGNATGEGAMAVVLEREHASRATPHAGAARIRLHCRSSRRNGPTVIAVDEPRNVGTDISRLLSDASVDFEALGFVNGYADGNRFVEDDFCAALGIAREKSGYDGPITVTNQEASFGHIAGVGGLVKLLGAVQMLERGVIGPVVNCREPYHRLPATPVVGTTRPTASDTALIVASGGGGDATCVLVEYLGRAQ